MRVNWGSVIIDSLILIIGVFLAVHFQNVGMLWVWLLLLFTGVYKLDDS